MPISPNQLCGKHGLTIRKSVPWGSPDLINENGLYIVSIKKNPIDLPSETTEPHFDENQIRMLIKNSPDITILGKRASHKAIKNRLRGFWLPDESILYIGKAEKQKIYKRVRQFYAHKVGKKSPHKGGYWVKLLKDFENLTIHMIETKNSSYFEEEMLKTFINQVSPSTRNKLIDNTLCLPFGNLQLRSRVIKKHGFSKHYQ